MGKRELVVFLNLSSWCLVMVEGLFLAVPWGCLRFVIVEFPDHTHLLFLYLICNNTTILLSFDPFLYFVFDKIGSRDIFLHGRQPLPSSAINSYI